MIGYLTEQNRRLVEKMLKQQGEISRLKQENEELRREHDATGWRWLKSTHELQVTTYGYDFPLSGEELADFVTWNHTAAVVELGEALGEVGWKPWAAPRGWVNRDSFIGELVDTAHFIGNMAAAVGCTDEEWEDAYQAKQNVNRNRQRDGYDGVSTKCPHCKRALDDVVLTEIKTNDGHLDQVLCACNQSLDIDLVKPFLD